eukprot:gene12027-8588_t
MGCSNSVATEVSIVRPPSPTSNSNQSRLDDDTVKSLTQTIRQIQRQQIVAQRKVTQSSLGFFTIPEEAIRTGSQPSSKEENFSSGLVFKDVADIASDPSKLFNIIKRGEVAQFHAFVGQYFHNCEATLHSLRGMWDSSPLLVAVQYGQFEIAHFLLDHPPEDIDELNRRNEKGCTVALYAVMEGNVDLVKRLIGFNVKMNIEPTSEAVYNQKYDQSMVATPLLMAVVNNHRRILGLLIDCGCNVDEVFPFPTVKSIRKGFNTAGNTKSTGVTGMRPILLACAYGHDDIVRELIWRVCDFHAKDDEQSNVLHHLARAAANSSKSQDSGSGGSSGSGSGNNSLGSIADVFRFLQSKSCVDDALLTGFDENGDTPLHVACDLKMHEYAQLLLDDGADASKLNPISGFTPLHISIRRRDQEMVTILLEYGANPLRKDEKGNPVNKLTPLEMASKLPAESEIGKAVNEAAAAWSNMRQPMLRKSIINLFPDAQPAEHIAMGHAQETKTGDEVEEFVPLDDSVVVEADVVQEALAELDGTGTTKESDESDDATGPLNDDGAAAAAFAAADADEATSQKLTKVPPLGGSVELDLASEQDAEESISIRIAASDAFEQALAFMEEFVQDTYAAESDQSSVPAATADPRPTATQQGTSTTAPTLRPTPPPPQSSKAAPSMSAEALAGLPSNPSDPSALNSSSTSNTPTSVAPKATATTTTGGTGNLRRRSLKPTAEASAKSNDGGATANETRDAAFVAKPPLSKKNSFQGSSRTSAAATASRRPSVSKTPNK